MEILSVDALQDRTMKRWKFWILISSGMLALTAIAVHLFGYWLYGQYESGVYNWPAGLDESRYAISFYTFYLTNAFFFLAMLALVVRICFLRLQNRFASIALKLGAAILGVVVCQFVAFLTIALTLRLFGD